jgi:hypothetical protein
MADKPKANKAMTPGANKQEVAAERKVKVRINPLRGIGGYGNGGDEVWMPKAEADQYVAEGYVTILKVEG